MKLFLKIFLSMVLVGILGLSGLFIYQTIKGRGGEEKTLEFVNANYANYKTNLDEFNITIEFETEEHDGSENVEKKSLKQIVRYENRTKKVVTLHYKTDGSIDYFEYVEYVVNDSSVTKKNYGKYEKGKTTFAESVLSIEDYEDECEAHPEIVMKQSASKMTYFISRKNDPCVYGKPECKIEMSTNVFTQKKSINFEFKLNETIDETWESHEHSGVMTIKDNKLLTYNYSHQKDYNGKNISGVEKEIEKAKYSYEKVPFDIDAIYDSYFSN